MKGTEKIKEASSILKNSDLDINFYGFVEGG